MLTFPKEVLLRGQHIILGCQANDELVIRVYDYYALKYIFLSELYTDDVVCTEVCAVSTSEVKKEEMRSLFSSSQNYMTFYGSLNFSVLHQNKGNKNYLADDNDGR